MTTLKFSKFKFYSYQWFYHSDDIGGRRHKQQMTDWLPIIHI